MKFDSYEDFLFFILGFSYGSGRTGWTGPAGADGSGDESVTLKLKHRAFKGVTTITIGKE